MPEGLIIIIIMTNSSTKTNGRGVTICLVIVFLTASGVGQTEQRTSYLTEDKD